jgi:hypothetical protein
MIKIFWSAVLMGLVAFVSGCAAPEQVLSPNPVCLPNTLNEQVMLKAQTVLEKMHFDIEKFDPQARYIRTRPLSGAQFFEFWRQDNASGSTFAQANLHSLRRIVELNFSTQDTATCIQSRVQVLRLSIPEQPIEGDRRMAGLFTESSSRDQTLEVGLKDQSQIEWLDAGPDHDLERKILTLIQKEIE